ncbi:MAG: hypothetical protein WCF20_00310 [Methylovirgula sp.]
MTDNANSIPPKGAISSARKSSASVQSRAEAIVNPASGLANDYLNLFNEIVMLIEQLPVMPELIGDILRWRPVSYQSYFAKSVLPGRASALEAYAALDAGFRRDFEAVVADLDRRAVGAVAAIRRLHKAGSISSPATAELCIRAGEAMREVLLKATELVNHGTRMSRETEQERADRLLYGNMRKVS